MITHVDDENVARDVSLSSALSLLPCSPSCAISALATLSLPHYTTKRVSLEKREEKNTHICQVTGEEKKEKKEKKRGKHLTNKIAVGVRSAHS
jgi:hypothetical protein